MSSRIRYKICPACGWENPEERGECPVCANRLFSDGNEEHQRYVLLIKAEHRKRTVIWTVGWIFVALVAFMPLALLFSGRLTMVPSLGATIAALFSSWRLVDLRKKMNGSARFLAKHRKG
jgi:RNA polymerase subunit RPABC4/transcription elongation factor Spt4